VELGEKKWDILTFYSYDFQRNTQKEFFFGLHVYRRTHVNKQQYKDNKHITPEVMQGYNAKVKVAYNKYSIKIL